METKNYFGRPKLLKSKGEEASRVVEHLEITIHDTKKTF